MGRSIFFLVSALAIIGSVGHAAVVEYTFEVADLTITRLCQSKAVPAVNGTVPGPTVKVKEGDTLKVHVINKSPYNMTIHWHGVFQLLSCWADGPNMITQCPIRPGKTYTYRFNITGQEGTLWWHAHVSVHRATVYGALVIRPRGGPKAYPFPKPYKEIPILLGEWWTADVVAVDNQAFLSGNAPNVSDAYTINGLPGDLYNCSHKDIFKLEVEQGKTYMLRIINAALGNQLFFKVAGHSLTVVAVDASYTKPYKTDVVVIAPGQTVDALLVADAPPARYYMAAQPYISTALPPPPFDNTTTTGIVQYKFTTPSSQYVLPTMPSFFDTVLAENFYTNLTSLIRPGDPTVPLQVDERITIVYGFGIAPCQPAQLLCNQTAGALAACMNNVSFQSPRAMSLLEAHFNGVGGIYTSDFPSRSPVTFDYTNATAGLTASLMPQLMFTAKGTKVTKLKYNSTVEIVLQNTAVLGIENHPMHLHGFNFFVLAQGFGNYDATTAVKSYNLVDPQVRNTLGVPTGGWAVIRFIANNPGVWILHCHLDAHLSVGLATAFEVENGPTPETTLPPPPWDLPRC